MEGRMVEGRNLKRGDTLAVWWGSRRDVITDLRSYGPSNLPFDMTDARIATFALLGDGMTIFPDHNYEVIPA